MFITSGSRIVFEALAQRYGSRVITLDDGDDDERGYGMGSHPIAWSQPQLIE